MSKATEQMENWAGRFGKEYTDRNALSLEEMESSYRGKYGVSRAKLNREFVGDLDRSIRILEVGSNIGNQLLCLQKMGFSDLWGIELQDYAVELSKSRVEHINIIRGSAFDIPYRNEYFDLVFTSGVLIHIAPTDIGLVMGEVYRCAKEYVWGFEYYADKYTEIPYRGHENILWKADFGELYCDQFGELELVKERYLEYLDNDNVDAMFLLRKRNE